MNCPVCDKPFIVVERNNIEVEYCLSCKGFWLDAGELELLKEILQTNSEFVSPFECPKININEKPYKCPKCGTIMKKVKINGVVIDVCPNEHGLWSDSGELSSILSSNTNQQKEDVINFLGELFHR